MRGHIACRRSASGARLECNLHAPLCKLHVASGVGPLQPGRGQHSNCIRRDGRATMRTVTLSLRHRILITLIPLLLLLAAIGSGGIVLLFRLGNSVDAILRENYRSVIAMEGLNEAV